MEQQEYKLSETEIQEIKEAFVLFDRDEDGCINSKELGAAFRHLGRVLPDSQLHDMIAKFDPWGNGALDINEFLLFIADIMVETENEEEITEAFKFLDPSKSGTLTNTELKHIIKEHGVKLRDEDLERMFEEADIAGEGFFDYEEYVLRMSSI